MEFWFSQIITLMMQSATIKLYWWSSMHHGMETYRAGVSDVKQNSNFLHSVQTFKYEVTLLDSRMYM